MKRQDIDAAWVLELYALKWSLERIADEMGCGPRLIRKLLIEGGVEVRSGGLGRGTSHCAAVLDDAKVIELRELRRTDKRTWSWSKLAFKAGMSARAVRKAVMGDTWTHVPMSSNARSISNVG